MCRKIINLSKLFFSTFFLAFNLQANDYDFILPENSFEHLSPVGLTKTIVVEPLTKIASEHPIATAVFVGTAIGAVCLVSKESSLRKQECASFSSSRPGLIAVPFQHGFQPYFLGSLCGSAVGVVAKSTSLKDQARNLRHQAEAVKIKIESNNRQLDLLVGGISGLQASAKKAVEQSSDVKDGVELLGKGIVELAAKQSNTKAGITQLGTGFDSLGSNIGITKINSIKLKKDVMKLDSMLRSRYVVKGCAETGEVLD